MDLINDGLPFLAQDARGLGVSTAQLRTAVRAGHVRRLFRGCYVDAAVPDNRELRCRAIGLILPTDAVVCLEWAAWLRGAEVFMPSQRSSMVPTCMVVHGGTRPRTSAIKMVEGYLTTADTMEVDGIPITHDVRTTSDLLRRLYRPFAMSAADCMAHLTGVDPAEVRAYLRDLKGYPGIVQARDLAQHIEPRNESHGESWQRLRVIDAGYPKPEPQLPVFDRLGRLVSRLDDGYEELKIGMFYDGRPYHEDDQAKAADSWKRDVLTRDMHWRIIVNTRDTIFGEDPAFERELGDYLGLTPQLPRLW